MGDIPVFVEAEKISEFFRIHFQFLSGMEIYYIKSYREYCITKQVPKEAKIMAVRKFPCVYMRGGTSKAVFFHKEDLPEEPKAWDENFF